MKGVLIVYHSHTGSTEAMARAVFRGASSIEKIGALMKRASETSLEDLLSCGGIALGTPENFGYMSGMMKDFFERTFYGAQGKVFRKPYVAFISAGNDGTGALNSIERIAAGYQLKKVHEPVISRGLVTEDALAKCEELGKALAAGLELGIY